MTTFRGVAPLATTDTRYALGYRYAVVTGEVTIDPSSITALNAALGAGTTGSGTLDSVVYTVARTIAEGDAESLVVGTATPASTEALTFESVISGELEGRRIVFFDKSLTPTGAPAALAFHMVFYGLVGDVFVPSPSTDIDDGPLTGPGGLKHRSWGNTDFLGLPVSETVEDVSVTGNESKTRSDRWTGYIRASVSGEYRFQVDHRGPRKLILGDNTYMSNNGGGGDATTGAAIQLVSGEDKFINLDCVTNRGSTAPTSTTMRWKVPGSDVYVLVPASVMYYGVNVSITQQQQPEALHYVQPVNRYLEA